jgi:UDPglucose--hexose-1-phosphate uridylyltransferase
MELASITERTYLIDPSGHRAEQIIEHRIDPLSGAVASINAALGEKAKAFLGGADVELLERLQQQSKSGCPFCNAAEKGTRYVPELVAEGQLRVGSALAMPNLFSKCSFDSVVIVDPGKHSLFPSMLSRDALADAIRATAELVRRARAHDPSSVHHVAGMNFLHPGGSSVPHPHLQVHVRSVPYSGIARAMRESAAFFERTGHNYWTALLETEQKLGARYLGRIGDVEWLAAFAPSHQREIWGVLPGKGSLVEIDGSDAAAFAGGISRIVTFYEESGTHPFTFAFFSSPERGTSRNWALHVRVCSRPAFKSLFANYDSWFAPKFVGDEVHTEAPEHYAEKLRARW